MASSLRLGSAAQLSVGAMLLVALTSAAAGASGCANGTTDVPVDAGARTTTTRDAAASATGDDSSEDAGEDVGDDSTADSGSSIAVVDSGASDASTATDAASGHADSGSADGGGTTTDAGVPTTDSGTGTCSSTPTIPSEDDGNECFGAGSDGCLGTNSVCCDQKSSSGTYTGTCVSSASSCSAPSGGAAYTYSCGTPADCDLDAYCVLSAATSNAAISVDSCGTVSGVKGSICATSPSTSDAFVCASNRDCLITVGGTCTAVSVNGKFFGICQ